jgi:GH15 family glucan-1,4-alpha-glucosidase
VPAFDPFPATDKDAITSAPTGEGTTVLAAVNRYDDDRTGTTGALIEEVSAFRSDVEQLYDCHVVVWDADCRTTQNARDDAVASDVTYATPRVPEVRIDNEFDFPDGSRGRLRQDVLVPVERPALLVRTAATFEAANERTLYTVLDLGIDDVADDNARDVDLAYREVTDDGEYVVAADGDRYLAVTQARPATGQRAFDGCRIGDQPTTAGPRRSAWQDAYVEADGWLDDRDGASGKVDAGVGLYVGRDTDVEWLTAVGFGRSAVAAVANARATVQTGYESARATFHEAWRAWHAGTDPPTIDDDADRPAASSVDGDAGPGSPSGGREDDGEGFEDGDGPGDADDAVGSTWTDAPSGDPVRDLYELSLTSLEVAQDPAGCHVAGAFKPHGMEYKHVWPRDQVIVIQALLAAGATEEARAALAWLADAQIREGIDDRGIDRRGTWWQNYYATGEPHWRALQLDQVGGPIYAHWLAWRETGDDDLLDAHYDVSRRAATFLLGYDNDWGFPRKHQDPWEEVWGYSVEGVAAAVAGLRCMAELAVARDESAFAADCARRAAVWADNLETYCYKEGLFGGHYVTADDPEWADHPRADRRPDAAAFMAVWPWNVRSADAEPVQATLAHADDPAWRADGTPCLGRYPGDDYTPSGRIEDGGWPLCEAYADVVRWRSGADPDAVRAHLREHAPTWTTAAGLLPERVDGTGAVRWNSNLSWSQATYVLLAESLARGEPYGLAPGTAPSSHATGAVADLLE